MRSKRCAVQNQGITLMSGPEGNSRDLKIHYDLETRITIIVKSYLPPYLR